MLGFRDGRMDHEPVFVLVPKEQAKNSFEARNLVMLAMKKIEIGMPPWIGGAFTGLLSDTCGGKSEVPYYNDELRANVRKIFSEIVPWLKKTIEEQENKKAMIKAIDIKKKFPVLEKYNEVDLLDAIRLELYYMGLMVENIEWTMSEDIVYVFKKVEDSSITPDLWRNGRYEFSGLGYEDDAMVVNECLYRDIIEKEMDKVINIDDIDVGNTLYMAAKKRKQITPENVIGKHWIVLVDYVD